MIARHSIFAHVPSQADRANALAFAILWPARKTK